MIFSPALILVDIALALVTFFTAFINHTIITIGFRWREKRFYVSHFKKADKQIASDIHSKDSPTINKGLGRLSWMLNYKPLNRFDTPPLEYSDFSLALRATLEFAERKLEQDELDALYEKALKILSDYHTAQQEAQDERIATSPLLESKAPQAPGRRLQAASMQLAAGNRQPEPRSTPAETTQKDWGEGECGVIRAEDPFLKKRALDYAKKHFLKKALYSILFMFPISLLLAGIIFSPALIFKSPNFVRFGIGIGFMAVVIVSLIALFVRDLIFNNKLKRSARLYLVDGKGNVYKYWGPAHAGHGGSKEGRHIVAASHLFSKRIPMAEKVNKLAERYSIDSLLLLTSCNEKHGKGGKASMPYIHAASSVERYKYKRKGDRNYIQSSRNGLHDKAVLYSEDGWYLVFTSGEEMELGEAIDNGTLLSLLGAEDSQPPRQSPMEGEAGSQTQCFDLYQINNSEWIAKSEQGSKHYKIVLSYTGNDIVEVKLFLVEFFKDDKLIGGYRFSKRKNELLHLSIKRDYMQAGGIDVLLTNMCERALDGNENHRFKENKLMTIAEFRLDLGLAGEVTVYDAAVAEPSSNLVGTAGRRCKTYSRSLQAYEDI